MILDRIEKSLIEKNLNPCVKKTDLLQFKNLSALITAIESITINENDCKIAIIESIDITDINLPIIISKYIINDLQKLQNGFYEVHIIEK